MICRRGLTVIFLIICMIVFSGCITINIHHKIKRTGLSDIELSIDSNSDIGPLLVNYIRNNLSNEDSLKNCIFKEEKGRISYTCKDLSPERASGLIDKKNQLIKDVDFKSEFIFPYYYYTYTFSFSNGNQQTTTSSQYSSLVNLRLNYYVNTFGEIVETNGQKTSDNEVLFSLDLLSKEDKQCKVVFKDFFILSWLGPFLDFELNETIKLVILGGAVVLVIGLIAYFLGPHSSSDEKPQKTKIKKGTIYCPYCGKPMSDEYTFCKSCGNKL